MNLPIPEPDPKHPDMSPDAIDMRLRHLAQIYKLAMSLRDAKWLGPVDAPRQSASQSVAMQGSIKEGNVIEPTPENPQE